MENGDTLLYIQAVTAIQKRFQPIIGFGQLVQSLLQILPVLTAYTVPGVRQCAHKVRIVFLPHFKRTFKTFSFRPLAKKLSVLIQKLGLGAFL